MFWKYFHKFASTKISHQKTQKVKWRKLFYFISGSSCLVLLLLASTIAIRLSIATRQSPEPEGILVLGGGEGREEFAAQFAQNYDNLDIWVSSGRYPDAINIFQAAGFSTKQVHFGWYAEDTVGDFAHHVKALQSRNIQHVYLITSDYHMPRAQTIATIIFGSQGIAVTPVVVPSNQASESYRWLRIARDTGRSVLWVFTGRAGGSVTQLIKG
jgi:uncharacterized SAM-binding protein YcdF (DUF218 family)